MSLLVVGSVALASVETPFGSVTAVRSPSTSSAYVVVPLPSVLLSTSPLAVYVYVALP